MKKRHIDLLLILTSLFVGALIGFVLGRSVGHTPIQVAFLPAPSATSATVISAPPPSAVPSTTAVSEPPVTAVLSTGLVNINTADLSQLMTLPGIGAVLAQRILDYRNAYGDFQSPEDLLNVSGIGTKRLESILDLITTGG